MPKRTDLSVKNFLPSEIFAYILAKLCYRDTDIIEDSHAACIECNDLFYKKVKESFSALINEMPTRINKEISFQLENNGKQNDSLINFAIFTAKKTYQSWDKPIIIREPYSDDVTSFVLRGKFAQACKEHWILDNKSMYAINQDVYNRLYTLICNQII